MNCEIGNALNKTISPWQVNSESEGSQLEVLEKTEFWKKWESSLGKKRIYKNQMINTAVIFRFLILEDVFHIHISEIEKEIDSLSKTSFAYNLKKILPSQSEIETLKSILVDYGYYDVIINKCKTYTEKEISTKRLESLSENTKNYQLPLDQDKCPHCKSTYIFKKKTPLLLKMFFTKNAYICSDCNASFKL